MHEKDRLKIAESLKGVDEVFLSIDSDSSVCKSLEAISPDVFANGGDRKNINDIPECTICEDLNIKMVDGLGKKIRASSEIIAKTKKHK